MTRSINRTPFVCAQRSPAAADIQLMSDSTRVSRDATQASHPAHDPAKVSNERSFDHPSPDAVDTMINTPCVAAQDQVDLGDIEFGRHQTQDVFVSNLAETDVASLEVQLSGDPAFRVVSAPARLRPSRERFDPNSAIKLELRPTAPGRFRAHLDVTLSWRGGRSETKRIVVTGAAHAGERTWDELDADAVSASRRAADEAGALRRAAEVDQAVQAEYDREHITLHEGHERRADDLTFALGGQVKQMFSRREAAVDALHAELGEFHRLVPPHHQAMIESIAWFALDLAASMIAGGIAKHLETAIKAVSTITRFSPKMEYFGDGSSIQIGVESHETTIPLVVGALTAGVKYLVKSGIAGLKPKPEAETPSAMSSLDMREAFVLAQKNSLFSSLTGRDLDVQVKLRRSLGPLLRANPDRAFAVLEAAKTALAHEMLDAQNIQLETSRLQWVTLLGRSNLGSRTLPDGRSVTNMLPANQKLENPNDESSHAMQRIDGLLDVEFVGDRNHPEQPVRVVRARLNGVRRKTAEALQRQPLGELGLPIRATGFIGDKMSSVTVVRDEAGAIDYVDNTALEWTQARWLSRKAGETTHASDDSERRGARRLMEKEIMVQTVRSIENDSSD